VTDLVHLDRVVETIEVISQQTNDQIDLVGQADQSTRDLKKMASIHHRTDKEMRRNLTTNQSQVVKAGIEVMTTNRITQTRTAVIPKMMQGTSTVRLTDQNKKRKKIMLFKEYSRKHGNVLDNENDRKIETYIYIVYINDVTLKLIKF